MGNPPGNPASRRAAQAKADQQAAAQEARLAREEKRAERAVVSSVQNRLAGEERARLRRFGRRLVPGLGL